MNSNDPLNKIEDAAQILFKKMAEQCHGFQTDTVVSASLNMLINAVRQAHSKRMSAINRIDELAAQMKRVLDQHYDPVTGGRRNIFPFHQEIELNHFKDEPTKRN
jgi:hypothetical protein